MWSSATWASMQTGHTVPRQASSSLEHIVEVMKQDGFPEQVLGQELYQTNRAWLDVFWPHKLYIYGEFHFQKAKMSASFTPTDTNITHSGNIPSLLASLGLSDEYKVKNPSDPATQVFGWVGCDLMAALPDNSIIPGMTVMQGKAREVHYANMQNEFFTMSSKPLGYGLITKICSDDFTRHWENRVVDGPPNNGRVHPTRRRPAIVPLQTPPTLANGRRRVLQPHLFDLTWGMHKGNMYAAQRALLRDSDKSIAAGSMLYNKETMQFQTYNSILAHCSRTPNVSVNEHLISELISLTTLYFARGHKQSTLTSFKTLLDKAMNHVTMSWSPVSMVRPLRVEFGMGLFPHKPPTDPNEHMIQTTTVNIHL